MNPTQRKEQEKMLLKIEKFEELAKRKGYRNGYELSREVGCGKLTYNLLKQGHRMGYDVVFEIYNRFGEAVTLSVIDFEEETLNGFTSKYVKVGNRLY